MVQKRILMMVVLLVVLSSFVVAVEEDTCAGFFGTIKFVLWGDPSLRENLAGLEE